MRYSIRVRSAHRIGGLLSCLFEGAAQAGLAHARLGLVWKCGTAIGCVSPVLGDGRAGLALVTEATWQREESNALDQATSTTACSKSGFLRPMR